MSDNLLCHSRFLSSVAKHKTALKILLEDGLRSLTSTILRYAANKLHRGRYRKTRDLRRLTNSSSPIIIDGGANRGQTIQLMQRVFENPQIYAFEPIPNLSDEIKEKYPQDDIKIINKAIGSSTGSKKLNISKYSGRSSLLDPSKNVNKRHGGEIMKKIEVDLTTLDDKLSSLDDIDILKLDLQGYELEALKGANETLRKTDLLLTEAQFTELYDDAGLFCELTDFLNNENFTLYDIYSLSRGPDGRLEWGDVIYLSSEKAEEYLK